MRVLAIATAAVLVAGAARAQAPYPNSTHKTGVIGLMHAIHSTNDVEKTLAFYHDVFGLNGQVRSFDPKGPRVLTNSPTASLRVAMTQLRGAFNFELTQFGDLERQMHKVPDIQDPGAPWMNMLVRNLDEVVANAKKVNATIVTKGGTPVSAPTPFGTARALVMQDPDGYFVEAIQATPEDIQIADSTAPAGGRGRQNGPAAAPPPPGQIVGAVIGETVRDMDATLKYWNGVLGMDLPAPTKFESNQAMLDLMGLPKGASYRITSGDIWGSRARIQFIEIKGVPRKPYELRVTDANASGMALHVGHIRDLLAKIKENKGRVMSRNEELVEWSDTVRNVFVKDPDGLNLELVGAADPNL